MMSSWNLHCFIYLEAIMLSSDIGCADESVLVSMFIDQSQLFALSHSL